MAASDSNVIKWALQLKLEKPYTLTVLIYSVRLCIMHMINNACYTPREPACPYDEEVKESTHFYRRNNVVFLSCSRERTAIADYRNHSAVCLRATENVPAATELYV